MGLDFLVGDGARWTWAVGRGLPVGPSCSTPAALIVFDIPLLIVGALELQRPRCRFPVSGTYASFVESGSYARIIWRTFLIASEVTIATALLGYPLAYWISRLEQRLRSLWP